MIRILNRTRPGTSLIRTAALTVALFLFTGINLLSAEVFVIANASNPMKAISKKELKSIFLGEKVHWKGGDKIKLVDNLDKKVAGEFYTLYVGKKAKQIKKIWISRMLKGKMRPPESFRNQDELIDYVASKPAAIAFVSKVDKTKKGITVLKVKDIGK